MRYHKMHRHWEKFGPPAYMAVAGYLGLIKLEDDTPTKGTTGPKVASVNPENKETMTRGTMKDLAAMFGKGVIQ